LAEFTGERVIPGEVDIDLLNEHLARYTFAARLSRGKRVLDAGCGAGYGSAELARGAERVVGMDLADDAVEFARAHYQAPNLSFERGSCTALPHVDASFDLVVAFEVIEHLAHWREFLAEARRVLAPCGQFIVSTPNRLYYTESRGADGANPFHVHEFSFDEFREELAAVFPSVALFLENHVEGVTFQPHQAGHTVEARVDTGEPAPDESHFFVAVCAHRPQMGNPTFVYVPRAANVLRERERHIALLERELEAKDRWLDERQREHAELLERHREQTAELERSNQWADSLNREIEERRARVVELQEELARMTKGYEVKVKEIEQDLREKTEWAQSTETRLTAALEEQRAQLSRAVEALHGTERDLEERTAWSLRLQEEGRRLEERLTMYQASRWVKLGRKMGLGPAFPPN
jgi:SAM-dependent methyltransferase